MNAQFNVADDPWVPVVRPDGGVEEVGLRAALLYAHEYKGIRDPLPIAEFGLHRLLVALALDIFAPQDTIALGELLDEGRFDAAVDAYFAKWANRFELFDAAHPFLQTPGMEKDADKPLAALLPVVPAGTNAGHFHHTHEDEFAASPAAAARLLTTLAPFMTAGGAGLSPTINGAPPWYVLLVGANLFETLCLNLYAMELSPPPHGNEPPAWRTSRAAGGGRRTDWSFLEALTWRPRRIQLVANGPGRCSITGAECATVVRAMKFAAGDACDFAWRDPSVPYRIGKDGPVSMRPQEGREIWRDSGPLAMLQQGDYQSRDGKFQFERPALVTQFAQLHEDKSLPEKQALEVQVYGMRTDMKMKVFEWQRAALCLPGPLVWNKRYSVEAQRAMDQADQAAYLLKQGIRRAYPREGGGNKNALGGLVEAAQRSFWHALRPIYDDWLERMAAQERDDVPVELRNEWAKTLEALAKKTFEEAVGDLDTDADAIERQVLARRFFLGALAGVFATEEEKTARIQRKQARSTQAAQGGKKK